VAEIVHPYDPIRTGAQVEAGPGTRSLEPFCCSNDTCRSVLGYTDGNRLVIGEAEFTEPIRVLHTRCQCETWWSPQGAQEPPDPLTRAPASGFPMVPFHCRNKKCRGVLGYTDGTRLVLGEAQFSTRQRMTHTRCRRLTTWYPVR